MSVKKIVKNALTFNAMTAKKKIKIHFLCDMHISIVLLIVSFLSYNFFFISLKFKVEQAFQISLIALNNNKKKILFYFFKHKPSVCMLQIFISKTVFTTFVYIAH